MLDLQCGDRIQLFFSDAPATAIHATVERLLTDQEEGMGVEVEDYTAYWIEIAVDQPNDLEAKQVVLFGTDFQYRLNGRQVNLRKNPQLLNASTQMPSAERSSESPRGTEEPMEFSEESVKSVKTLKFAKAADNYLSPWRDRGVPDSELTKLLAAVVAWTATGHSINEPPAGAQSYEFAAFALSHAAEIDSLTASVGDKIFSLRAAR